MIVFIATFGQAIHIFYVLVLWRFLVNYTPSRLIPMQSTRNAPLPFNTFISQGYLQAGHPCRFKGCFRPFQIVTQTEEWPLDCILSYQLKEPHGALSAAP